MFTPDSTPTYACRSTPTLHLFPPSRKVFLMGERIVGSFASPWAFSTTPASLRLQPPQTNPIAPPLIWSSHPQHFSCWVPPSEPLVLVPVWECVIRHWKFSHHLERKGAQRRDYDILITLHWIWTGATSSVDTILYTAVCPALFSPACFIHTLPF